MAQPTNTFDTYDSVGEREDLSDVIYSISPTDTPFISSAAKTKATAVLHEWQTDALAAAATNNAVIEGDEATLDAVSATTRLSNSSQIMDKTVVITGTQESVDKAGRASELAYQIAKKAKELKSAGATEIEVTKEILKGNIKWKEEVEIDEKVSAISLGHGGNALKTARIKYKRGSDGFVVAKKDLGKAKDIVSKSFRSFLKSRSPMSTGDHDLPKVTAEEVEIEEARKAAKDIGL